MLGEWRSLVARLFWEQNAAGSNPVSPTSIKLERQYIPITFEFGAFVYFHNLSIDVVIGNTFLMDVGSNLKTQHQFHLFHLHLG